ncbi:hypothetical protein HY249_01160 [Candidatus Azambacteria bacterium]|nr:hypothetical protein [Candidatus Azambacteria bacterium]
MFPVFSKAITIGGVEYNNIRGWAWSDNIGWVSFSCHGSEAAAAGITGEIANCASQLDTISGHRHRRDHS